MFCQSFFPKSYFPPGYWEKLGASSKRGGGTFAAGLTRVMLARVQRERDRRNKQVDVVALQQSILDHIARKNIEFIAEAWHQQKMLGAASYSLVLAEL